MLKLVFTVIIYLVSPYHLIFDSSQVLTQVTKLYNLLTLFLGLV